MKKFFALPAVLLALCMLAVLPITAFAIPKNFIEYEQLPGVPDTGIMDFSWLNEMPAGQHGYVQVVDGNFQFEDGTPVKFWGSVCGWSGAYPTKEDAEKIAADLASMGVNFCRIHAIDCIFGGQSSGIVNFAGYSKGIGPDGFNEELLDRLDYLVYCLKEKGIYIHMDTSAGRRVAKGEGFDADEVDISSKSNLRGGSFFDDRVTKIEYDYAEDFLVKHVNPYTKLNYCSDPAIAVIQRVNESSALWVDWEGKGNSDNGFTLKLKAKFNAWLLEKYGTREALAQAWTNDAGKCGLGDDEDPSQGTVLRGTLGNWSEPHVVWTKSFKKEQNPARQADWLKFLSDCQNTDFNAFCKLLRDNGYKGSINCSNLPAGPLDLYNNSLGDVTEINWYFNTGSESAMNSMVEYGISSMSALPQYFTRSSCAGKALVVTEMEVGYLSEFRADFLLQMASYGSLQDWDGFCAWIYASSFSLWDTSRGVAEPKLDPAYFGEMGIAAMIFRLGMIKPAVNSVEYVFSTNDLYTSGTAGQVAFGAELVYASRFALNFFEDKYEGNADLVIASGNNAYGDYSAAKNLVIQTNSPYKDAFQKEDTKDAWLASYTPDDAVTKKFGARSFKVSANKAVCDTTLPANIDTDLINGVMREFGLWDETVGYVDGKVISDTKELVYDYTNGYITCDTDQVCFITGVLPETVEVGDFKCTTENDKASIVLLSTDGKKLSESESIFFFAIGRTRNKVVTENEFGYSYQGSGPVYYEDIRGTFSFKSDKDTCTVWGLDADGRRQEEITATKTDDGFEFPIAGHCNYEIRMGSQNSGSSNQISTPVIIIIAAVVVAAIVAAVVIIGKKKK